MPTLKAAIAGLTPAQMSELLFAFEQGTTHIVHCGGWSVAVNYTGDKILESNGAWSLLERK